MQIGVIQAQQRSQFIEAWVVPKGIQFLHPGVQDEKAS